MFSYPWVIGNRLDFTNNDNSVILSESFSRKLFGDQTPIGKMVSLHDRVDAVVIGVFKDLKENTHLLPVDAFINIKLMPKITQWDSFLTERGFCSMGIFFLEAEGADLPVKAPVILDEFKKNFWLYKEDRAKTLQFTPLKQIYFSAKKGVGAKGSSKRMLTVLSFIVGLILVFSISNYINLTTAQASFRSKEIAIKKLVGSSKRKLFFQLVLESLFITFVSLIIAVILVKSIEPIFNNLLQTKLNLNSNITFYTIGMVILVTLLIGFVSGVFPAMIITNFNTIEVVKGTFRRKSKGLYSKLVIVFQYTVSIALLAGSFLIIKQTRFLKNYDIGFNRNNVIRVDFHGSNEKKETIKNALKEIPYVEAVSIGWGSPLDGGSNQSFTYNEKSLSFQEFAVDDSFYEVFDIPINRNDVAHSKDGVYLNEIALKELMIDTVIPTSFLFHDKEIPILGTVNNFNFNSLTKSVEPLMIYQQKEVSDAHNLFIKLSKGYDHATLEIIKSTYNKFTEGRPYEITYVDDTINKWYEKEDKFSKIIGGFTILSILISFLGILATSLFYLKQRQKEMSIRSVLGAPFTMIYKLIIKDFFLFILIAILIALPIGWYFVEKWLQGFAYRITIEWYVFLVAGLIVLFITISTVSYHAIKAAKANPIKSLKTE